MLYVKTVDKDGNPKPVTTKHDPLGEVSFEVEVGQVQDQDEMIRDAGGIEALIEFYNGARATNAKNVARALARNYVVAKGTDPSTYPALVAQLTEKAQNAARDYSPASDSDRGPSKAKKAAGLDSIKALVDTGAEITRERLLEILAGAGIK